MSTAYAESPPVDAVIPNTEEPLFEVVRGERVELPPMSIFSNVVTGRLFNSLENHLSQHKYGTVVMEALLVLDREINLRRRPDVAFVAKDRWPLDRELPESGDWEVVPTLAIEVTSPHDLFADVHAKVIEYFDYGVEEVWVVFPEKQQLYQYTSPTRTEIYDEQMILAGGERFPGFEISLRELFRRTVMTPSGSER